MNYFGIKIEPSLLLRRNIKRGDGFSLVGLEQPIQEKFAETAPDFRIDIPGLNLEVRCEYCKKFCDHSNRVQQER